MNVYSVSVVVAPGVVTVLAVVRLFPTNVIQSANPSAPFICAVLSSAIPFIVVLPPFEPLVVEAVSVNMALVIVASFGTVTLVKRSSFK